MKPATIKNRVSSGGVIFRKTSTNGFEIALVAVKHGSIWCLPKGIVEKGESPEEASVREVKEETGLSGRVIGKIGNISYWYFIKEENTKCRKTVHFYLLEYLGGSTLDHNWEVDNAVWVSLDEAVERVSYQGDRNIVKKAKEMLLKKNSDP